MTALCVVDGCDGALRARGFCSSHWNRWKRYGDPLIAFVIHGNDRARLLSHIDRRGPDECWPWLGFIEKNGYGKAFLTDGKTYAHRAVFVIFVGPIPTGFDVDHTCHNADSTCVGGSSCLHRRCVNPTHLEPATRSDNMRRAYARTR